MKKQEVENWFHSYFEEYKSMNKKLNDPGCEEEWILKLRVKRRERPVETVDKNY